MINNEEVSILKQRYSTYSGKLSIGEAIKALDGFVVKQNRAGQLYIHHAEKCGADVVIPFGIDYIKPGAFRHQTELKRVDIQARITEIQRYTFFNCFSLEEVSIPDSVLSIGEGAFEGCSSLVHITIPASVHKIKSEAFRGCMALNEVELLNPNIIIEKKAFMDDCALKYSLHQDENDPDEYYNNEEEL